MLGRQKRNLSAVLCVFCVIAISACSRGISAAVTPLSVYTSSDLAGTLNEQWVTESIGDTFSIDFPTPLSAKSIGNTIGESGLYELTASGISMYALMRPYSPEDEVATKGCDALRPGDGLLMGINLRKKFLCSRYGSSLALIGFNNASEVLDLNAVLFFVSKDHVVHIDHVLSLAHMSPGAQDMIDAYFRAHPSLTQRWFDEPSSMQLDKKLEALLNQEMTDQSPSMKAAMAFLERIQASAQWNE